MAPVVVASELSPHAAEALQYALRFRPGPVHLFHVHDVSHPEPYGITLDDAFRAANEGTTSVHVDAALTRATDGMNGVQVVWRSQLRPAEAVARYAREVGAELIVIGTHGLTGFRRLMLGSVAEAVMRQAPCDVLAVPLDESAPWSERPTRRVLCAVDLSEASETVADRAAEIADRLGVDEPLAVLHVDDPTLTGALREAASGAISFEVADDVLARLERRYDVVAMATGAAAPAIMARADTADADLVVVGRHGHRGAARALGSVAARVLREAHRPVLVVRTDT